MNFGSIKYREIIPRGLACQAHPAAHPHYLVIQYSTRELARFDPPINILDLCHTMTLKRGALWKVHTMNNKLNQIRTSKAYTKRDLIYFYISSRCGDSVGAVRGLDHRRMSVVCQ